MRNAYVLQNANCVTFSKVATVPDRLNSDTVGVQENWVYSWSAAHSWRGQRDRAGDRPSRTFRGMHNVRRNMSRHLLAIGLMLTGAVAGAAPAITAISGTAADNQEITITGSGFGSNPLRQEFLGGQKIDALANGARIDQQGWANWSLMTPSTSTYPHVTTERGWSNGKSIAFDTRGTTEYKQTLFYDTGSNGYATLYTNALIYLDHMDLLPGSYLQWKMMRWYKVPDVLDHAQSLSGAYMANRIASSSFFGLFNSTTSGQQSFWMVSPSGGGPELPGRRAWYRYETWVRMNSTPGVANGTFRFRVTNPVTGQVYNTNTWNNIMYNAAGDSGNLRYLVLQNYFGNASDGGYAQDGNGQAVAFWDDVYISQSEARVEVCDQSTYSQCVNKEIQLPTSWADGRITVRLNKGNKSQVGAYLYVVDSTGAVNSQGYRLGTTVAPNPPSSVSAQ